VVVGVVYGRDPLCLLRAGDFSLILLDLLAEVVLDRRVCGTVGGDGRHRRRRYRRAGQCDGSSGKDNGKVGGFGVHGEGVDTISCEEEKNRFDENRR
jgi:hypothetical protein